MIRFRVSGRPAPQGSKRHVGGGRMVESSRAVGPWREAVRAEAQRQQRTLADSSNGQQGAVFRSSPLSVGITFLLPRPAGHYGTGRNAGRVRASAPLYPAVRPDVDKLTRAVLDGLVMGGAFADDSQVVSLRAAKMYAQAGEAPGAVIEVEAMIR